MSGVTFAKSPRKEANKNINYLPSQKESLGDWTSSNLTQVTNPRSDVCCFQFLNKTIDGFFQLIELSGIANKRLTSYNEEGKKISGQGDPRLSIYVGNSSSISKVLYNGIQEVFESELGKFYSNLFDSEEHDLAKKYVKADGVLHVVIFNSFWMSTDHKLKNQEIIAAASFVLDENYLFLLYLGVKDKNIVWPYELYEGKEQAAKRKSKEKKSTTNQTSTKKTDFSFQRKHKLGTFLICVCQQISYMLKNHTTIILQTRNNIEDGSSTFYLKCYFEFVNSSDFMIYEIERKNGTFVSDRDLVYIRDQRFLFILFIQLLQTISQVLQVFDTL